MRQIFLGSSGLAASGKGQVTSCVSLPRMSRTCVVNVDFVVKPLVMT